jgi:hypothetical protein
MSCIGQPTVVVSKLFHSLAGRVVGIDQTVKVIVGVPSLAARIEFSATTVSIVCLI